MSLLPGLLLAALVLQARDTTPPAARAAAVPPTRMGVELLASCPLVVVGRTVSSRPAGPGVELLHVSIVERVVGTFQPGDLLSVLSPERQFAFGSEDLLFLKPWRGDERYEVALRVASTEPRFEAKLALTRRMAWLMEIPEEQPRIEATLSLVIEQLRSADEWTRSQGIEELRWMTERLPALFTAARRARLVSAGSVTDDPRVAAAIEAALRRLRATDDGLRGSAPKEQSRR